MGIFFPEDDVDAARNNLRVLLSRLRSRLGEAGAHLLRTNRLEVQFDSTHADCWLDVIATDRLITQAAATKDEACIALLEQAAALHRGEFLQGLTLDGCEAFDQWLMNQRELHLAALGDVLSELVQLYDGGRHYGNMIRVATRQLELDPLNEAAHRTLIRALAAQGKHAQALTQFNLCARRLQEALGIPPAPETQALADYIRGAQSVQLASPARHNLPAQLTSFVGRQREVADIVSALTDKSADTNTRLVTLTGDGGVGKTRSALQVATACMQHFADGVFFVPLISLTTVEDIPGAVLQAMNIVGADASQQQTLLNVLHNRHTMLVLDNLEHLLDRVNAIAVVDLVLTILQTASRVAILVTTRQRLGMQAEDVFTLRGLPIPASPDDTDNDAVQLFAARARRVNKSFVLSTENLPYVAQICALVGGMPLAIELAAASSSIRTCSEIVNEIKTGLDVLRADLQDLPPSHRSIWACFEPSWARLSSHERDVAARLSVFQESFSTQAATTVCKATPEILARLHACSLLAPDMHEAYRHTLHPLLRSFLSEMLQAKAQTQITAEAHAGYFHHWMAEQAEVLEGSQPGPAMAAMRVELSNLRTAWMFALAQRDAKMLKESIAPFADFLYEAGLILEASSLFYNAVDVFSTENTHSSILARARLLQYLALFEKHNGHAREALALANQALALAESSGDALALADALCAVAAGYNSLRQTALGQNFAEQALNSLVHIAPSKAAAIIHVNALHTLAESAYEQQNYAVSLERSRQALSISEAQGLINAAIRARHSLSTVYADIGLFHEALSESSHVVAFARQNKLDALLNRALLCQSTLFDVMGDYARAQQINQEALVWARETGNIREEALLCVNLGISYDYIGRYADAIQFTQRSLELWQRLGRGDNVDTPLVNLALHHHHNNNNEQARITAMDAIRMSQQFDRKPMLAYGQTMLGHAEAALGNLVEAECAYAEALALADAADIRYLSIEPRAGLARVDLQRGEAAQARQQIEPVLAYLAEQPLAGLEEPFRVHLTCVQVLRANNDLRAEAVLDRAQALLRERARQITDEDTRNSYLERVAVHHELLGLK